MGLGLTESWAYPLSSNALSATLYEELGSSSDTTGGQMTPSAALRDEPESGSLARGRPQFIHHPRVAVKPTLEKEAIRPFWSPDLKRLT